MTALFLFSVLAVFLVMVAGRKDVACDPRLTMLLLVLLGLFPLMLMALPKLPVLPVSVSAEVEVSPVLKGLGVVWLAGFLVSMARLGMAVYGLGRWYRRSLKIGVRDGVELRLLDGLRSPVAAGVIRRVIYLPENWMELGEERRGIILAHEMAHHRRRDPLCRLLVEVVRAVHWYHPGVHWMARRFAMQSEFACDELVLKDGAEPRSYAEVLCDYAQRQAEQRLAIGMAESSSLEQRVRRMVRPPSRRALLPLVCLGLLGLLAAVALGMLGPEAATIPAEEVELRFSANPFPGE